MSVRYGEKIFRLTGFDERLVLRAFGINWFPQTDSGVIPSKLYALWDFI